MKPSSSRAVFHIGRTIQNPRSVCNRSSLRRHTKDRLQHGNAQKTCEPDRTPHPTAHRHQHRRNRGDVRIFNRQQKQRQHRQSRQNRRRSILPQLCRHWKACRVKICNLRANARKIFVSVQNHTHRKAHQHPHRRNWGGVHMFSKRQKQRQHHRSRQNHPRNVLPQLCRRWKTCRVKICKLLAYAQTIFVPVRKHARRRAHQRPLHWNKGGVPTFSRQQKWRQHRRSRQNRRRNILPHQLLRYRKMHRDRHRKRPVYAQMVYDCVLNRTRHLASQPQHHKSLDGVLSLRKRQKKPQSSLPKNRFRSNRLYRKNRRSKKHRVCAQRTCAYDRTHKSRKVPPCQRRRNKEGVRMYGRQRNPAQNSRLRGITSIRSSRKFALRKIFPSVSRRASVKSQRLRNCVARCRLNQHQRKHRTFGISSRLAHGRRVPLNHLPCAALNVLSENAQQMHRRMIYRPRRRRRHGKPLQKSKRSSLKIHPSNPSIHPNRLPRFYRSRLFRKYL